MSDRRWIHYSDRAVERLVVAQQTSMPWHKPFGFWISHESRDGWLEFCRGSNLDGERLRFRHEVEIAADAYLLHIETAPEMLDFTERYGVVLGDKLDDVYLRMIDWHHVALDYQGIVIAPYQYPMRYDLRTLWYYPWDCASGCIWNPEAISIVNVTEVENEDEAA